MSDNSNSGGLGVADVLTIVFVVLKLVGTITWSCGGFYHPHGFLQFW